MATRLKRFRRHGRAERQAGPRDGRRDVRGDREVPRAQAGQGRAVDRLPIRRLPVRHRGAAVMALQSRFWRLYVSSATSNLADRIGRTALPLLATSYTRSPLLISG